jgi:hypothetical protein
MRNATTIKIGFFVILLLAGLALVAGLALSDGEIRFALGNSPQALAEAELIRVEAELAREQAASQIAVAEAQAQSEIALAQELEGYAPQLAAQEVNAQIWKSRVTIVLLIVATLAVVAAVGYAVWYFRVYVPTAAKAAADREARKPVAVQIGQFVALVWPEAVGMLPTILHQRSPGTALTPGDTPGMPQQVDPQTAMALGYATSEADAALGRRSSVSGDLVQAFSRRVPTAMPVREQNRSVTVVDAEGNEL